MTIRSNAASELATLFGLLAKGDGDSIAGPSGASRRGVAPGIASCLYIVSGLRSSCGAQSESVSRRDRTAGRQEEPPGLSARDGAKHGSIAGGATGVPAISRQMLLVVRSELPHRAVGHRLGCGATPQTRRTRCVGNCEQVVPLTDFQTALARLLSENRTFDSYLAGGAAILIEPNTTRFSRDLDYFHDSEARVAEAFAADRTLLEASGYSMDLDLNQPGYIRAVVRKGVDATK